jgi:hypothetical protein
MKFKWEMMHGCQCEQYVYTLEEIEKVMEVATKPPGGRALPHKPMKDFELGEYLEGSRLWAYIERIE